MAKMHSRGKGKSKSHKPFVTEIPDWVPMKKAEVEDLIVSQYRKGTTMAQIGAILRDQYGVPSVELVCDEKISKILKKNDLLPDYPEDLINLIRRAINLRNHLLENRKDLSSTHGLKRIESKIYRLAAYYRKSGRIPKDWKYDPKKASVLIR
jgi:small subunit ribosomal protein S15